MIKQRGKIINRIIPSSFCQLKRKCLGQAYVIEKFAYNNAKYVNTSYTLFQFNCNYYACVFVKNKTNPIPNFAKEKNQLKS